MRFEHWTAEHFAIILLTAGLPVALVYLARNDATSRAPGRISFALAGLLFANFVTYVVYRVQSGYWELRYDLPMEFCNWSTVATVVALVTRNRTAAELSYFWVLTGSLNGVVTPDLQVSFPHIYYFIFWIAHSGLVVASLFVVFGLRLYPRPGAVPRTLLLSQVYFASAFCVNLLLESNYGYLMKKPPAGSLLDHLGPWPYYILAMQGLALVAFIIVYLPFYFVNRRPSDPPMHDALQGR